MAKPVQIVTIESVEEKKISVNLDSISGILAKCRDLPVAVYSVNGVFNTGKSSLLNNMLRFYYSEKSNQSFEFFKVRSKNYKGTLGVWMWSEPLLVKKSNGIEIALLLVDTQGSGRRDSNGEIDSAIFAISAMKSSKLLYNVNNAINRVDLNFLNRYCDSAKNYLKNSSQKTFQEIVFVLHDFEATDIEFGEHSKSIPIEKNYRNEVLDKHFEKVNIIY